VVIIYPTDSVPYAEFYETVTLGHTDENGAYSSHRLAPKKYYVPATLKQVNRAPECIAKIRQAKSKAYEVGLTSNSVKRLDITT
jgi:hypothetical protein